MAFYIDNDKLRNIADIPNENIYKENNNTLIKKIDDHLEKQINYLINIPVNEHVIKPIETGYIVYEEGDYSFAYRMRYLNNAKNLYQLYTKNISYEEKINYAKQAFEALQFLHQYIVLGDIHAGNILVQDNNVYLIDLDHSLKRTNKFKPILSSYYLNSRNKYGNNKYTDIIKMYLEFLSLILDINFANYISHNGYQYFVQKISKYSLPPKVLNFLKISTRKEELKKLNEDAYNFENYMDPNILDLKRNLSFFNHPK